jgi:hypothetical protein
VAAWGNLLAAAPNNSAPGVPLTSSGWEVLHVFEQGDPDTTSIDTTANRIEGSIPLPPGTHWRVQAVTGITAGHNVFNVAFRSGEPQSEKPNWWFERLQAQALSAAGGGDISAFGAAVAVADMTSGATHRAEVGPGYYERVYVSDYTVAQDPQDPTRQVYDANAEGYINGASSSSTYGVRRARAPPRACSASGIGGRALSALRPLPARGRRAARPPAALHGLSQTHAAQIEQPRHAAALRRGSEPILVSPLGRGPYGWYSDSSERDVLDALADARRNYPVGSRTRSRERLFDGRLRDVLLRLALPAALRGLRRLGRLSGDGCCARRSPTPAPTAGRRTCTSSSRTSSTSRARCSTAARTSSSTTSRARPCASASRARTAARVLLPSGGDHFTYLLADDWAKEAASSAGRTRERRPRTCAIRAEPWVDAAALGIRHDRAYWVHDIVGRGSAEDEYFDVELTSWRLRRQPGQTAVTFPAATGTTRCRGHRRWARSPGQIALAPQNRLEDSC